MRLFGMPAEARLWRILYPDQDTATKPATVEGIAAALAGK